MVYKTYQEANIAHPYRDIYVSIDGKFAPDFYVAHIALCGIKEGWNKYQPQTNEFNTDSIAVTEQEEEEFNAMANNSEIPNSSEWKNGDACSYYYWEGKEWRDGVYVIKDNGFHVIRDIEDDGYAGVTKKHLRKPETQEQREDREKLEAAYDLYCLRCDTSKWKNKYSFDEFQKEGGAVNGWLAVVDKTNYRLTK